MEALAEAPDAATIQERLGPIVTDYRNWLQDQQQTPLDPQFVPAADDLLHRATRACNRIEAGLNALTDLDVLTAFRIANKVIARARRQQLSQERGQSPESFDPPQWRPFQIAFILLNLMGIIDPSHSDREVVDLLFFPTGGGKTEAYLGLAAFTLRLLVEERRLTQEKQHLGVVWTGPEIAGSEGRDTAIVVRQMFSQAQHNVLISSFAIDEGPKGQELFRPLAKRMGERPDLQVRMFLNVKRKYTDTKPSSFILREFAEIFRNQIWPGDRLPEVFYDPRSLEPSSNTNACLHAKCVVIDEEKLLVTSANFTEAAHLRNIEAGILVENRSAARAIRSQFEMLVSIGLLRKIPGI
jgi:phosphatidylserine/phosphatidylglycerophosphate/cardiolipin synthase-like enzyme